MNLLDKKTGKIRPMDVSGCLKEYADPKVGAASFRQARERAWEKTAHKKALKTAEEKRQSE